MFQHLLGRCSGGRRERWRRLLSGLSADETQVTLRLDVDPDGLVE